VLTGSVKLGSDGGGGSGSGKDAKTPVTVSDDRATLKYGLGYFSQIKERNSDDFVSMSEDAGAKVDRGVITAGALYQKGGFSIGAIDYYSPDIINIGYAEAKMEIPINDDWKPRLAFQFTDQRSVGDDLLKDEDFSAQQMGIKAELPVGPALFSAGYTYTAHGANMQNPWSGYPGYTSVQVEDFNRAGEDAFLLRAAYDIRFIEGLSAYALWVHGTEPDAADQFARDEVDFNLQWAPKKGVLKGLSLRLRYAMVEQHGGDSDRLTDLRAIANYAITF
jgi:outer membrane porin, OprD family